MVQVIDIVAKVEYSTSEKRMMREIVKQ
jgi:hypothetical protein